MRRVSSLGSKRALEELEEEVLNFILRISWGEKGTFAYFPGYAEMKSCIIINIVIYVAENSPRFYQIISFIL